MTAVLDALTKPTPSGKQTGRVVFVESPTGSGKSLSLMVSTLTYLEWADKVDLYNALTVTTEEAKRPPANDDPFDWLNDTTPATAAASDSTPSPEAKLITTAVAAHMRLRSKLLAIHAEILLKFKLRTQTLNKNLTSNLPRLASADVALSSTSAVKQSKHLSKQKKKHKPPPPDGDEFCVDDNYKSNDEHDSDNSDSDDSSSPLPPPSSKSSSPPVPKISDYDLLLPHTLSAQPAPSFSTNATLIPPSPPLFPPDIGPSTGLRKIVYAARTHSQLSQFISELSKTKWNKLKTDKVSEDDIVVSVVHAAGRKVQCCNKEVNDGKRGEDRVTELCLDLQKGKTTKRDSEGKEKGVKCPYLASSQAQQQLSLHLLASPHDVEDLASVGESSGTCSYYASRSAIPGARLVCVPYQILFSKEARKALGIDLKGCTVIVDEAHNIPEAIRGMASSKIDLEKVERAERAVNAYVERYETRLKGKNLEYCMQIKRFVQCLAVFLRKLPVGESSLLGLNEFMFGIQCDNINLCKVDRYIVRADLNKKLLGFITAAAGGKDKRGDARDDSQAFVSKHISPLRPIHDLIKRLSGSELDGKVVVTSPKPGAGAGGASPPSVRYFMLNPSTPFAEVVGEAQAVILAGGTLRPFSHICSELLPAEGLEAASLADSRDYETPVTEGESSTFFSCDHVVPRENVHCISLSHGPDGNLLEFNYANRQKEETLDSLGRSITNLCNVVPAGVVVFLPSYAYEAEVVRRWKDTGAWEMIKSKKRVFREPKDAKDLDATLSNYSRAVAKENGAVLFSVVGGKMSEGINFADDMARCVVVVGLPFPDSKDPELKEKMQHLDKEYKAAGNKGITGQSYYFNLCMRAVNQSIGRAIRHRNDHASIVLCDRRYITDPNIWKALPGWIRSGGGEGGGHGRLTNGEGNSFGRVLLGLREFFNAMKI